MPHLFIVLVVLALAPALTARAQAELPDPATFGPWAVGHRSFTAIDAERDDRELQTEIWYPVDAAQAGGSLSAYPIAAGIDISADIAIADAPPAVEKYRHLLVFSHGYRGISTQSASLLEVLASHGFIVVAPEHTGNAATSDPVVADEQAVMDRVPDLRLVIDVMLARARDRNDDFYQRVHPTRVGVLGHSFGGTSAVGMELGFGGAEPDPRVVAILPLAGAVGVDFYGEEQLANTAIPTLLISATEDSTVPIQDIERAFNAISGSQPVYRVDLQGAAHTHFTEVCKLGSELLQRGFATSQWSSIGLAALLDPYTETCTGDAFSIAEAVRLQNLYAVAFFKTHLSGDLRFARFLTRAYAADNEPLIAFDKKAALATLARVKFW